MNHRPFEDWLLEDRRLTIEQERELQAHLRVCNSCAAIAESNLALHSTHMVSPATGFVSRFGTRLATHHKTARIKQVIGMLILIVMGLGLFYWLANPLIQELMNSPAAWITNAVSYILFILTSIQALSEMSHIFVNLLSDFVSPLGLFVIFISISGLGTLEVLTILQFTRPPQGA